MNHSEKKKTEEIVSIEEYLEKRQKNKKSQVLKIGRKNGSLERAAALELAVLFV